MKLPYFKPTLIILSLIVVAAIAYTVWYINTPAYALSQAKEALRDFPRASDVLVPRTQQSTMPELLPEFITITFKHNELNLEAFDLTLSSKQPSQLNYRIVEVENDTEQEVETGTVALDFSPADLSHVYRVLRDRAFDTIETNTLQLEEGVATDAETTVVTVSYVDQHGIAHTYTRGNTPGERVIERHQERWNDVVRLFRSMIDPFVE